MLIGILRVCPCCVAVSLRQSIDKKEKNRTNSEGVLEKIGEMREVVEGNPQIREVRQMALNSWPIITTA